MAHTATRPRLRFHHKQQLAYCFNGKKHVDAGWNCEVAARRTPAICRLPDTNRDQAAIDEHIRLYPRPEPTFLTEKRDRFGNWITLIEQPNGDCAESVIEVASNGWMHAKQKDAESEATRRLQRNAALLQDAVNLGRLKRRRSRKERKLAIAPKRSLASPYTSSASSIDMDERRRKRMQVPDEDDGIIDLTTDDTPRVVKAETIDLTHDDDEDNKKHEKEDELEKLIQLMQTESNVPSSMMRRGGTHRNITNSAVQVENHQHHMSGRKSLQRASRAGRSRSVSATRDEQKSKVGGAGARKKAEKILPSKRDHSLKLRRLTWSLAKGMRTTDALQVLIDYESSDESFRTVDGVIVDKDTKDHTMMLREKAMQANGKFVTENWYIRFNDAGDAYLGNTKTIRLYVLAHSRRSDSDSDDE